MKNNKTILVVGDLIAIALVTVIGFATHGETGTSFLPRMAASFFPVSVSWFLLAPWFGLFDEQITSNSKLLWRIPLVMLFSAPLAVILRAVILGSAALPVFTLVLGSTSAFGMLIWRALYLFLQKKTA
jgi:hypothetical protein